MQFTHFRLTFRARLLFLFLLFSTLPLIIVAIFVSKTVADRYKDTLNTSFQENADLQQQLLIDFIESQKTWINSITSDDILLSEVEQRTASSSAFNVKAVQNGFHYLTSNTDDSLFASLVSLQQQNFFIEKAFIADANGNILVSTSTDDLGGNIKNEPMFAEALGTRQTYFGKIINIANNKRVIPLSSAFIRKSDSTPIAVLVVEFNQSIIKSLMEGTLYLTTQPAGRSNFSGQTYILDDKGYPLTALQDSQNIKTVASLPLQTCAHSGQNTSGSWVEYTGQEVFGVSRCLAVSDFIWTLVVEQPVSQAFKVSNELANIIYLITGIVGIVLIFVSIRVSQSITDPIKKLQQGAMELGRGKYDQQISLHTHDEFEELASSFNQMTEQILHRENLVIKEKREMETILQSLTDGVFAIDQKGIVLFCNKTAGNILSQTQEAIAGKPIDDVLVVFDDSERLPFAVYSVQSDEAIRSLQEKDLTLHIKNESVIHISLQTAPISFDVGNGIAWIVTCHDNTKDRELEEMKLDFVSMAAHELRTPLTSIRGYALLINDLIANMVTQEAKDYINRLIISSNMLSGLVENLLNVSRIERNTFSVEKSPIDLVAIITNAVMTLSQQARTKKQILTFSPPPETLPLVMADSSRINQVVTNLIANAIAYTGEGGAISVGVKKRDAELAVSVSDNGQGIPQEALPKLFTKFFRVSGTLEQGSKGTGLGLYITKSIIEMHQGKIWVESELGKGTTFYFTLPIATNEDIERYKNGDTGNVLVSQSHQGVILNKARLQERVTKNNVS